MSRSRAVRTGFSGAIARPGLFLGELTWRWVFGITTWLLIAYGVLLFLGSIKVSDLDLLGLYGIIPGQFRPSLEHIFGGSGPRILRMIMALALGAALIWLISATAGRSAILKVALPASIGEVGAITRLHLMRLAAGFAAALAYVGSIVLALSASRVNGGHEVAEFYFVLIPLLVFVGLIWNAVNWYLSLAPIIAFRGGMGPWAAMAAAASLSWRRSRQFTWIGFVFGGTRFLLACTAFFFLLGGFVAAAGNPAWVYFLVFLAVSGAYFFVGDFLHIARLLACIRVLEWDEEERNHPPAPPAPEVPEPGPVIVPAM